MTAAKQIRTITPPTHEEIAVLAYELWEIRGCPEGSSEEDWFSAERQLTETAS
jgi:hypothetical protein